MTCEDGWWRDVGAGAVRTERDVDGVRCVSAGPYVAGLRRMVLAHKEQGVRAMGEHLAEVVADLVLDSLPPGAGAGGSVLLVPVPSRPAVVRARGDDPWRRVVRAAAVRVRRAGIDAACRPILATGGAVRDQAGLDRKQRALNVQGAVRVRPSTPWSQPVPAASTVVLCDDVVTSGATVRACLDALSRAERPAALVVTVAAVELRAAVDRAARESPVARPEPKKSPRTGPDG